MVRHHGGVAACPAGAADTTYDSYVMIRHTTYDKDTVQMSSLFTRTQHVNAPSKRLSPGTSDYRCSAPACLRQVCVPAPIGGAKGRLSPPTHWAHQRLLPPHSLPPRTGGGIGAPPHTRPPTGHQYICTSVWRAIIPLHIHPPLPPTTHICSTTASLPPPSWQLARTLAARREEEIVIFHASSSCLVPNWWHQQLGGAYSVWALTTESWGARQVSTAAEIELSAALASVCV